jgi:HD-GYP domain-containing protein (c-di-GMP phosphodiesterase class II)
VTKAKAIKNKKSHLSEEDKKIGKIHIYILVGMIIASIVIALYLMH